jgi:hypothetical protein
VLLCSFVCSLVSCYEGLRVRAGVYLLICLLLYHDYVQAVYAREGCLWQHAACVRMHPAQMFGVMGV